VCVRVVRRHVGLHSSTDRDLIRDLAITQRCPSQIEHMHTQLQISAVDYFRDDDDDDVAAIRLSDRSYRGNESRRRDHVGRRAFCPSALLPRDRRAPT